MKKNNIFLALIITLFLFSCSNEQNNFVKNENKFSLKEKVIKEKIEKKKKNRKKNNKKTYGRKN